MRAPRIFCIAAGCLTALCACGGGGGDGGGGGGPFVVTDLTGSLVVGEPYTVAGAITPDDIRAPDGSYLDLYLVTPEAPQNLRVEMRSTEVDSYLFLFTDGCLGLPLSEWEPCLLWQDDDSGTGLGDAYFEAGLMAGEGYIIAANTLTQNEFGAYALEVLLEPGGLPPSVTDLTGALVVGDPHTVEGTITSSDISAPDGSHMDLYGVTPADSYLLSVAMRSAWVDSYLYLFTDDCLGLPLISWFASCLLEWDDDSGGNLDALILYDLTAGEGYIIGANTFEPDQFGTYTLEVLLDVPQP